MAPAGLVSVWPRGSRVGLLTKPPPPKLFGPTPPCDLTCADGIRETLGSSPDPGRQLCPIRRAHDVWALEDADEATRSGSVGTWAPLDQAHTALGLRMLVVFQGNGSGLDGGNVKDDAAPRRLVDSVQKSVRGQISADVPEGPAAVFRASHVPSAPFPSRRNWGGGVFRIIQNPMGGGPPPKPSPPLPRPMGSVSELWARRASFWTTFDMEP